MAEENGLTEEQALKILMEGVWLSLPKLSSESGYVLCSMCLSDEGLVMAAKRLGSSIEEVCVHCGSNAGAKLGKKEIEKLVLHYFVRGSQIARHLPPLLVPGRSWPDRDFVFSPALQKDYELLKDVTGFQLMRNAPKLIPMGLTSLREEIEGELEKCGVEGADENAILGSCFQKLLVHVPRAILSSGTAVYRARVNPKQILDPEEYDAPPPDKCKENRLNRSGMAVFYGALDRETCLLELKPELESIVNDEIVISSFRLRSELKVLDFQNVPFDPEGPDGPGSIFYFVRSLFYPHTRDYRITQALSSFVSHQRFDGVIYPSAYSYIRQAKPNANVAFYGFPLKDGRLELKSTNKVVMGDVVFGYDLGPAISDNF